MAGFNELVRALRRAEKQLERQLHGIRVAISSLEMGSAVSPSFPDLGTTVTKAAARNPRQLSAAARKAISDAQKRRWAKHKADKKPS